MLVSYFHVIALTTLSCLAGMIYAKPVAIMQERGEHENRHVHE